MSSRRVQIIGGGPGGLTAALLLKRRHPAWEVELHERMAPEATFGFGVGLSGRTLRNLLVADPDAHDAIRRVAYTVDAGRLTALHDSVPLALGRGGQTIGRAVLLDVLSRCAQSAGVALTQGSELHHADTDADLVIAADGVNSATRTTLAADLGASVEVGASLYLWLGLDKALSTQLFAPVETEHGIFVTHAYPYAPDRSTVLIETDEATWRRAGLDAEPADVREGASDEVSLALLQQVFAPHLEGGTLIGNRSRWTRFRTVRCRRWHVGSTVLLGDAARTAHYSLGSGSKLAIEDAIALVDALDDGRDVPTALTAYEDARRPRAERIQDLAHRSQLWWDDFPLRAADPAANLAVAYLSRGGVVSVEAAARQEPAIVREALANFGGVDPCDVPGEPTELRSWVLAQPFASDGLKVTNRILAGTAAGVPAGIAEQEWRWAPDDHGSGPLTEGEAPAFAAITVPFSGWKSAETGASLDACGQSVRRGAHGVVLQGPGTREALLDRLALGELVRRQTSAVVVVEGPEHFLDDLVDGLVAGRADLIVANQEMAA